MVTNFSDALVHGKPTTAEDLALERQRLIQRKDALERCDRLCKRAIWIGVGMAFVVAIIAGLFAARGIDVPGAVAVAVAMGMAGAVGMAVHLVGDGVFPAAFVIVAAVLGAMAGAVVGAGVWVVGMGISEAWFGSATFWGGVIVLAGTVVGAMVVLLVSDIYEKRVLIPLKEVNAALDDLIELEASDKPNECIAIDEWRSQDHTVDTYLHAVARLGRKPVVGEYEAAKAWMKSAEQRQRKAEKQERARQACERMAVAE